MRSGAGNPVRDVPAPAAAPDAPRLLGALTSKPVLYVANVEEGERRGARAPWRRQAARRGDAAVAISARVEGELAEIDDAEEAAELRGELGVRRVGPGRS